MATLKSGRGVWVYMEGRDDNPIPFQNKSSLTSLMRGGSGCLEMRIREGAIRDYLGGERQSRSYPLNIAPIYFHWQVNQGVEDCQRKQTKWTDRLLTLPSVFDN